MGQTIHRWFPRWLKKVERMENTGSCRGDDRRVEKRQMTGWGVRKVSQGRKEASNSLPIHLPTVFSAKRWSLDGLNVKCLVRVLF